MDAISYGLAAKQKQRIEKVIAEPDSASGVITVPQVIATGETITVPTGRTAVLPNVQVDGELVVDGEVFIPSGSSYTTTNINVSGAGSRITGDFSNPAIANRTSLQTNVSDGRTAISVLPNGTNTNSSIAVNNNSDVANSASLGLYITDTLASIDSYKLGTGSYLPITFNTNGLERMRIDTAGNIGIGTTNTGLQSEQLHIANSTAPKLMLTNTIGYSWSILVPTNNGELKFKYEHGNITPLTIDRNGNVLFSNGTFGYGTGSGGIVTQLTSKSTAVTLNKPSGQIVMNNAALASNTAVNFNFSNSLLTSSDSLLINISSGGTQGSYAASVVYVVNGVCVISVKNISTISLSEALVLNFTVIKGAVA